jgi:mono/diheme cytochrome c family protein
VKTRLLHCAFVLLSSFSATTLLADEQLDLGKTVYMTLCVACHQPTGAGLPPVFPSLVQTDYVSGSTERFAAMILKGVMGPITVKDMVFNNMMPPQEALLTDEKIAAAITYVRASFGNTYPAVAPGVVTAARSKFADRKTSWTEAELKAWPDAQSSK